MQFFANLTETFDYDLTKRNCRNLSLLCLEYLQPEIDGTQILRDLNQKLIFVNMIRESIEEIFKIEVQAFVRIFTAGVTGFLLNASFFFLQITSYILLAFSLVENMSYSAMINTAQCIRDAWPTIEVKVWRKSKFVTVITIVSYNSDVSI